MARPRDWSPLEGSDPVSGEPERITDEARRLRDMATEMRSQISRLRAIGQDDNKGRFADTLRTAAADLAGQLEKTVGRYQRVAGALSSWAPELVHAQTESVRALEKAKAAEATRVANTVIRALPRPGDPPPAPAEQARQRRREAALDEAARDLAAARRQLDDAVEHAQRKGRHYAERIKNAIDDDVKDSWWDNVKAALGEFDDGTGLSLASATGAGAGGRSTIGPPEHGTAADNARWWASLSDEQRRALIDRDPGALGNLDGLPAWVRNEANRARLDDERAALEAERDRLQADLDDNWFGGLLTNADAALEHVKAKLASLDRIQATLDKPGKRQLLLLDLSGERAEAAVAVGNVDDAKHVAVFTPGLGSTVDGDLERYDDNMAQLQQQAQYESNRYGDREAVATVTWIGYQAPQKTFEGINPFDSDSMLRADSARAGGADLAEFYRGIDASRTTDPHLTALGHSYGSTTTGFALQERTGVDDAVVFGSPGIGTSHIEDVQVPAGHTYRIEARNDFVADTGVFGIDPSHLDGMTGLSAREETPPDRLLPTTESTGHSGYLTQDSTSQYNMSVVVAGLADRRVADDGRGLGDIGSWPIPGTY